MALLADSPWGQAARWMADGRRDQVERLVDGVGYTHVVGPASQMADDQLVANYAAVLVMKDNADKALEAKRKGIAGDGMGDVWREWTAESAMAHECTRFCQRGRHIVQFDAALTTEFRHTDLDGVLMNDVTLPWESFYIAFDGPDAPCNEEMPLEGCFVSGAITENGRPRSLTLLPAYRAGMKTNEMPVMLLSAKVDDRSFEAAYRDEIDILEDKLTGVSSIAELTRVAPRMVAEQYVGEIKKTINADKWNDILTRMLNLVGNALLYLASHDEDTQAEWQRDAPRELLARAQSTAAGGRKAGQALVKQGYTRVRYVGLPTRDRQDASGSGTVRAHWRRGHWRRQHYGPKRALIKLVRIRPTLVAGTSIEANRTGRIHVVDGSAD